MSDDDDDDYVEVDSELATKLQSADDRVDELYDQLRVAEGWRQELLNDAVAHKARFKVGDNVTARGRQRYRVTKVQGEYFQVKGVTLLVRLKYYGQRVKVDGSLHNEREKWIWDLKPIGNAPERN